MNNKEQQVSGHNYFRQGKPLFKRFIESDHEKILACLTDDISWEMPGMFHLTGKEAFDKEIENDYFEGSPTIRIIRLVEENSIRQS